LSVRTHSSGSRDSKLSSRSRRISSGSELKSSDHPGFEASVEPGRLTT
jgi:hypothetical protein